MAIHTSSYIFLVLLKKMTRALSNMVPRFKSLASELCPQIAVPFSWESSVRLVTGKHLPYYAAKILMPFLLFYSVGKCHLVLQLLRIVGSLWPGQTTTTTTLPQSISIWQPPTCLKVVDPSDHHSNNLFSYQPSLFISILPRLDQHCSPTRVSAP